MSLFVLFYGPLMLWGGEIDRRSGSFPLIFVLIAFVDKIVDDLIEFINLSECSLFHLF